MAEAVEERRTMLFSMADALFNVLMVFPEERVLLEQFRTSVKHGDSRTSVLGIAAVHVTQLSQEAQACACPEDDACVVCRGRMACACAWTGLSAFGVNDVAPMAEMVDKATGYLASLAGELLAARVG